MADEDMGNVFEKFFQRNAAVDGVGLGLSICKEIAEAHGGRIEMWSDGPGEGSTVMVTLPVSKG